MCGIMQLQVGCPLLAPLAILLLSLLSGVSNRNHSQEATDENLEKGSDSAEANVVDKGDESQDVSKNRFV